VDGAFRENLCRGGWGCIIRDAESHMVAARAESSNKINCVSISELTAVREALMLGEELDINKLIVESDVMLMVQAINRREEDLSASAVTSAHMSLSFNQCVVQFAKRDCSFACTRGSTVLPRRAYPHSTRMVMYQRYRCNCYGRLPRSSIT
jgi:ribonuclease HI